MTNPRIAALEEKLYALDQRFKSDMADHWQMYSDILRELQFIREESKDGNKMETLVS